MTATPPERDRVDFGTPRAGGGLGGLHWRQLALLAAAAAWAILWTRGAPGAVGAVVGLTGAAALVAAAFVRPHGRLPLDWGVVVAAYAMRALRGRRRFRRHPGDGGGLPMHMDGVAVLAVPTDQGPLGLLRDGRLLIAVLDVAAEPLALLPDAEQAALRAAWGGILAGLARPGSPVARVQWIARSRDLGPRAATRYLSDAAADPGRPTMRAYLELLAVVADETCEYDLAIAIGVEAGRPRAGAARRDGAQEVLDAAWEVAEHLRAAGLGTASVMDPGALATALRIGSDPAGADGLADRDLPAAAAPPDPRDPGPMAAEESWGWCRADGSWHATFWISQWPRGETDADVLVPLIVAGRPGRTTAVVMEPRDPVRALRDAEAARLRHDADDDLRARTGFVASVRRRRQQAAIGTHERELADGHAAYRFAGYVTVSAPTHGDLVRECTALEVAAHQAGCELRRLWGEQAAGLGCTLPLCRGLA